MNKASDLQTANPQAGYHYTQRRFSSDQVSKELGAINVGILTLGKIRRTHKKEVLMKVNSKPMPQEPPCYIPSTQKTMRNLSTQQKWQQQQKVIANRKWQLQQQKYPTKSVQNNSPSLARASSHSVLTEAMRRKFSDDESYSSDSSKDAIAVSFTKDRQFKKFGSDWDLSKKQSVGIRTRQHAKSSTLPNFMRGQFKSESDLRDVKFDQQPPALPPRNNPFKNSYVRKVEIQRPRTGEYGVAIDCTKINPTSAYSISSKVQNFPFVRAIDSKSPFAKANIKRGDYLLKVNDTPTEGINPFVLEYLIKTSKMLQLVVATFQSTNQRVPNTPVAKVNNSMTFDNLPPRPLLHGAKYHTLERISSRRTTGLYEVIDEISLDSSHSQATVKQRNWSDPKTPEGQVVEDTKIDFLPIAKAVVGLKTKPETLTKNQNSLSENSSGFVSEAESHENSSGGSVGIPNQEDNNKNQEKPITNPTAAAKQIPEGTINASKDKGPPPLPPKKIHLSKTATFPLGVYQNESSRYESGKFAPNGRASNPDVSFVSVSINLPKGNKPFCPVVAQHRQDFRDIHNDEVFIDQATNTGIRITFPKSIHTRPSAGILEGRDEFAGQSSKIGQQITRLDLSRRDEEIPPLVLAPPDDFADSGNETARPQLQSWPLVIFDNELRPAPSVPNDLGSSKIIYSGTKVTEKASKSDLNLWSLDEVLVWLRSIGLDEEVVRSFDSSRVDGKALLAMKRADLIAFGLRHMEERRDFERALKRLQLRNI